jgi:peptide/nickel transport system permease protein
VVAISAAVGVTVGLVAGWASGPLDAVLMRLVDLQLAIPPLLLFIAVAVFVRGGMVTVILLLSAIGWLPYARIVRTRTVSTRDSAYVAAARLAGVRTPALLVRHLLPGSASLIFVLASMQAGIVLLWESGLSFLGLGLTPPTISLGFLVSQGRADLADAWWIVTFPGLTIVLLVLAFNLIGDGLRDRFNIDDTELGR